MTIEPRAPENRTLRLVAWAGFFVLGVAAVLWSMASIRVAEVFTAQAQDTGNMWQTMWNVAHGYGFTMTFSNTGEQISRLAIHADYLLVLLAPLSWFGSSDALVVLQAFAVVAGAWFLWSAVIAITSRPTLGYALAGSYLLSGAVVYPVLWQVHPVTFLLLFGLAGIEAIVRRRRAWVLVLWFGLALITKENVGYLIGPLWWYFLRVNGQRRLAWWLLGAGLAWSIVHFAWIIPAARTDGTNHFAWTMYYGSLGETPGEILRGLFQGGELGWRLMRPDHLVSVLAMILPLAGLACLSPVALFAIPAVAPHWLSDTAAVHTIFHVAHVPALVVLLIAGLDGLRRWRRIAEWRWLPLAVILSGLAMSVAVSPYPWSRLWQPDMWTSDPGRMSVLAQRHLIPPTASISFTRELGPQWRSYKYSALFPQAWTTVEYVVIHEPVWWNQQPNTDKTVYQWYREFLDRSAAFERLYVSGTDRIYRRIPGSQLEPVPAEYLPGTYTFY